MPESRIPVLLTRIRRRLNLVTLLEGAGWGLILGSLLSWLTGAWSQTHSEPGLLLFGGALLGSGLRLWLEPRRKQASAALAEQAIACGDNLIVTAAEVLQGAFPDLRTDLAQAVTQAAERRLSGVHTSVIIPATRSLAVLGVGLLTSLLTLLRPGVVATVVSVTGLGSLELREVNLTITPPSYTGRAVSSQRSPERINVLEGSTLTVSLRSGARLVTMETVDGLDTLTRGDGDRWSIQLLASKNGFLSLKSSGEDDEPGKATLIGLTVTPDQAPRVRISDPGKDLKLSDGTESLDIQIDANDDIGLSRLIMRYTRVSGSGENFSFTEGEIPLSIERIDQQHWQARARWNLAPLALDKGDLVVYRAVVWDRRPGSEPVESDALIAEVLAPGSEALGGFEADPEIERYALSQQMVILKIERLLASKPQLTNDSLTLSANLIAAEQRSVRAEYVFMMGGEMSAVSDESSLNEEEHAEAEGEMMAGHEKNQGRVALTAATRLMSQVISSLNLTRVEEALPLARQALDELEKAFSHSRILLRALSVQERLDLSRRLTGPTDAALPSRRPSLRADPSADFTALQATMAGVLGLGAMSSDDAARAASGHAEAVLRTDPSDTTLQAASQRLSAAAKAFGDNRKAVALELVGEAARLISAHLGNTSSVGLLRADPTARRLQGGLRDASGVER